MDWLKLFALLVAVASVPVTADGPKKKIRIHLPQKVKHIHHHKKIYITNHPALPHQYAPAFLSGAKGPVALPSNVGRPAVASLVPFNSAELLEDPRVRLSPISSAASKLLPLYRARGHYGPHPTAPAVVSSDWEDHDYELAPPPEPSDIYEPSGYAMPTAVAPAPSPPPKKFKIVKVNDLPRKKVIRKLKPKRVIMRGRPVSPTPPPQPEEELPVSSFHEQFYSDIDEAGTIRKIRKPPRIEKIIDGDTEHIHTYSEEHIHKVVFDDDSKVTGVVGVDPIGSMSALNAAHPLVPLKNAQTLVAIPTGSLGDLSVMGSMGTPSHLEYASYNPRDVTHDHVFHDHGEVPAGVDIAKEGLRLPPKVSYNSNGLKVSGNALKRYRGKRIHGKHTKPIHDFTYYETIYANNPIPFNPAYRPKKYPKPTLPTPLFDSSSETSSLRPFSSFKFKDTKKTKTRNYGYKTLPNFELQQASVPAPFSVAPFSVSSKVVHDYEPKGPSPTGFSKYRDSLNDYKESYSSDFNYDAFASSSNIHTSEDKTDSSLSIQGKPGKSVSTQNISFGGQDRQTFVDHLAAAASSNSAVLSEPPASAPDGLAESRSTAADADTPTPYTIKETSPAHSYYTAMALQALHGDEEQQASDEHAQYAAQPTDSPLATTTTSQTLRIIKIQSTDAITEPGYVGEARPGKRPREQRHRDHRHRYKSVFKDLVTGYADAEQTLHVRHNPKYGDKI